MRRVTIGLAIVLALSLMLAAVAIAAPPDFCDPESPDYKLEGHPSCSDTSTTPPEPSTIEACPTGTFAVTGGQEQVLFECEWTPQGNGPSTGTIAVIKVSGEVSHLVVMVRDSSPGDLCELSWPGKTSRGWEWYQGPLTGALDLTFPLTDNRGTYWNFVYTDNDGEDVASSGEHWCGPYDPIDGLREDLNGEPLNLRVILDGNKNKNKENASVNVTLSSAQEVTSWHETYGLAPGYATRGE
jgi:hypothetical protein